MLLARACRVVLPAFKTSVFIVQVDIDSYTPKPLIEASFGGAADDVHIAALTRFYTAIAPEKLGQVSFLAKVCIFNVWSVVFIRFGALV